MTKETIIAIIGGILIVVGLTGMLMLMAERDRKLFREELIWYSRFQIVEEMYLEEVPDNEIARILLEEAGGGWTEQEIREDLMILRSY